MVSQSIISCDQRCQTFRLLLTVGSKPIYPQEYSNVQSPSQENYNEEIRDLEDKLYETATEWIINSKLEYPPGQFQPYHTNHWQAWPS